MNHYHPISPSVNHYESTTIHVAALMFRIKTPLFWTSLTSPLRHSPCWKRSPSHRLWSSARTLPQTAAPWPGPPEIPWFQWPWLRNRLIGGTYHICKAHGSGNIPRKYGLIWAYMAQYRHFRILKLTLILCQVQSCELCQIPRSKLQSHGTCITCLLNPLVHLLESFVTFKREYPSTTHPPRNDKRLMRAHTHTHTRARVHRELAAQKRLCPRTFPCLWGWCHIVKHSYGKSPCWMGKSAMNSHVQWLFCLPEGRLTRFCGDCDYG